MLYVGTSGWQYRDWRGRFYPSGLPTGRWLDYYAARFQVVELNASFYRLPSEAAVARWGEVAPPDFVFAAKASRYLTHVKRLRDAAQAMDRFFERMEPLGPHLGPVLLQLPPTLEADPELLDQALSAAPSAARVAVEFRHRSWFTADTRRVLERRGSALCVADRRSRLAAPLWATADWGYVRLHEGLSRPPSCYGETALRRWPERIADTWGRGDVFVFFNNDHLGCAVANAARLASLCRKRGLVCARAPEAEPNARAAAGVATTTS